MSYNLEDLIGKITCADCLDVLRDLPDKCVDLVLTDPPYGYLKTQFDIDYFDDKAVFSELARVLKPDGLIAFTGRGDTFYEWNLILNELGIPFKEEIVWNKIASSNPLGTIARVHELIAIRGKKTLNKIKINFIDEQLMTRQEMRIIDTIKRIKTEIPKHKKEFLDFIETGKLEYDTPKKLGFAVSVSKTTQEANRGLIAFRTLTDGSLMKSIFACSRDSVYDNIHPTQKPVELFSTLLKLCSNENDIVLDCFSGSGTTAVACHNLNRRFICIEKDPKFAEESMKRLQDAQRQQTLF